MNKRLNIVVSQDEEENSSGPIWDGPLCFVQEKPFIPKISLNTLVEDNYSFNSQLITLDGKTKSDLMWDQQLALASDAVTMGKSILWYLDMGLFHQLPFSLDNNSQCLTLALAVEHFCREVWPKFKRSSLGLVMYQGGLDFTQGIADMESTCENLQAWLKEAYGAIGPFVQDSEIEVENFESITPSLLKGSKLGKKLLQKYSYDVAMHYIHILMQSLIPDIESFAMVDASSIHDRALIAQMLSGDGSQHLRFIVKNCPLPYQDIGWESPSPFGTVSGQAMASTPATEKYPLGLCVPEFSLSKGKIVSKIIDRLVENNISFRLIHEELLTTAWDGLDYLVVASETVDSVRLRMLQGFCAAGGTVVTAGDKLGVDQEITLDDFSLQNEK